MRRRTKTAGLATTIPRVVDKLRSRGFKPYYVNGELKDWRRVRKEKGLQIATVTVSGNRASITIRAAGESK